jgi:hypothetical protein
MKVTLKETPSKVTMARDVAIGGAFLIAADVVRPVSQRAMQESLRMRIDTTSSLTREPSGFVLAIVVADGAVIAYDPKTPVLLVVTMVQAKVQVQA